MPGYVTGGGFRPGAPPRVPPQAPPPRPSAPAHGGWAGGDFTAPPGAGWPGGSHTGPFTGAPGAHPGHAGPHVVFGPPRPHTPRPPRTAPVLLRTAVIAAVVLAVGMAGVIREIARDTGSGYGEAREKGDVAWALKEGRDGPRPAPIGSPDVNTGALDGTWFSGDTIVRSERTRVIAYRVDTGRTAWEWTLPEGRTMCAAAPDADGGIGVVLFGQAPRCDRIAGVDVARGTPVWEKPVSAPDTFGLGTDAPLAVSGGVAVAGGDAYAVADGARSWSAGQTLPANCSSPRFTGGAGLVAIARCRSTETVFRLDPATGRPMWSGPLPGASYTSRASVVSTSPVVLAQSGRGVTEAATLLLFDDAGKATTITDGHPVVSNPLGAAPRVLASADTLYVPGNDGSATIGAGMYPNQIVAIDRATGRPKWTTALPAAMKAFGYTADPKALPVRVDEEGGLVVYVASDAFKPTRLVRFAPGDGKVSVLKEYPTRVAVAGMASMPRPYQYRDMLFLVDPDAVTDAYRVIALT